jgi:glycosyltransferase involved in cell wall biosynthesis
MQKISVVVPLFNEAENVKPLHSAIKKVMLSLKKQYEHEIVFIDDGSSDKTLARLKEVAAKDPETKVLVFGRNFGQTPAMAAGIDKSTGDLIVTIDGDLQNDPADIPKLLKKMREKDLDVVSGWRYNRKDPGFAKKVPSKLSNKIARFITGVKLNDFGCSLKVYRKECLEDIRLHGEMHRYIPALVARNGFKVGEEKVNHNPRTRGTSKYNYKRLLRGFLDLIIIQFWTAFATKPMHFFGGWGIFFFGSGFLIGSYKLLRRILFAADHSWGETLDAGPLLLFAVMLMILGIQLFMFGFLGDMVIRTYYSHPNNRIYKVRAVLNDKK